MVLSASQSALLERLLDHDRKRESMKNKQERKSAVINAAICFANARKELIAYRIDGIVPDWLEGKSDPLTHLESIKSQLEYELCEIAARYEQGMP